MPKIRVIGWLIIIFALIELAVVYFYSLLIIDYGRHYIAFNYLLPLGVGTLFVGVFLLFKKFYVDNIIYWAPGVLSIILSPLGFLILLVSDYLSITSFIKMGTSRDSSFFGFFTIFIFYILVLILIIYGLAKGVQGIKNNKRIGWINVILSLIAFIFSILAGGFVLSIYLASI